MPFPRTTKLKLKRARVQKGPTLRNLLPVEVAERLVVTLTARDDGRLAVIVQLEDTESVHVSGYRLLKFP